MLALGGKGRKVWRPRSFSAIKSLGQPALHKNMPEAKSPSLDGVSEFAGIDRKWAPDSASEGEYETVFPDHIFWNTCLPAHSYFPDKAP